ncbi:MAG: DUF6599 family protein [Bryobacteraceae bacterium]
MQLLRGLAFLSVLPLSAAIFPEQISDFERGKVTELKAPDAELYDEYGFQGAEQAEFAGPSGKFTVDGWRFRDSTGAMAAFQLRRPPDATRYDIAPLGVKTSKGAIFGYGSFVFEFTGLTPTKDQLELLLVQLKQVERSPLPTLPTHLPTEGLVPNSERYILGPVSLSRFAPQISPSLAAFHLSAEGQLARYTGDMVLTIFEYPTPNMGRERQEAFLKLPGALPKRSGPLVAVVLPPADPDAAERVLAKVFWDPKLTNQNIGQAPAQGIANIVLTGFLLAGVLIAASLFAGFGLGGFKAILKRRGWYKEHDAITVLRIKE